MLGLLCVYFGAGIGMFATLAMIILSGEKSGSEHSVNIREMINKATKRPKDTIELTVAWIGGTIFWPATLWSLYKFEPKKKES